MDNKNGFSARVICFRRRFKNVPQSRNMVQDPDMSAEIGLELGGVAVASVFTGGAAAAWYVTRFAQLGNRARTAAQMANRGRRLNRFRLLPKECKE